MTFYNFQMGITLVIWVIFAGLKIWAFVDCLLQKQQVFPAVERQTKILWLVLTGIAALTGLVFDPLGLVGIAGVVIALIYLFEIKPRIQQLTNPRY